MAVQRKDSKLRIKYVIAERGINRYCGELRRKALFALHGGPCYDRRYEVGHGRPDEILGHYYPRLVNRLRHRPTRAMGGSESAHATPGSW